MTTLHGTNLRKARKMCQMRTKDVAKSTGLTVSQIVDAERGWPIDFDTAILWQCYQENEKPPRFEGKHKSVGELRNEATK